MKKALLLAGLCAVGAAHAEKWNKGNNPDYFNAVAKKRLTHALHNLPLEAKLKDERLGWSETFWPSNLGGIAYRWNSPNPQPFKYKSPSKEQVARMSEEELGQLSPAELYDIAMGDYKYTLTKKILKQYSPDDLWWEGICHGWSLAAANYPEPDKTVVINPEGIRVPFGASDVKGLLAMHDAFNSSGMYARVGDRCDVEGKVEGEAFPEDGPIGPPSASASSRNNCKDVNAGAFHIVIANMIGINSQGFVADVDRFNDVWNQPVTAYSSKIHEDRPLTPSDMKNGIARKVRVTLDMTYGDELEFRTPKLEEEGVLGFVSKEPVTGTPAQTNSTRKYEYVLELNSIGDIVGGEWISESRPDILWMKLRDKQFLNQATGGGILGSITRAFKGGLPLAGLSKIYVPVKAR